MIRGMLDSVLKTPPLTLAYLGICVALQLQLL